MLSGTCPDVFWGLLRAVRCGWSVAPEPPAAMSGAKGQGGGQPRPCSPDASLMTQPSMRSCRTSVLSGTRPDILSSLGIDHHHRSPCPGPARRGLRPGRASVPRHSTLCRQCPAPSARPALAPHHSTGPDTTQGPRLERDEGRDCKGGGRFGEAVLDKRPFGPGGGHGQAEWGPCGQPGGLGAGWTQPLGPQASFGYKQDRGHHSQSRS